MALTLLSISVVVVGQEHNPTILNPDFLKRENIVPGNWDHIPEDMIVSPPFSQVSFTNGFSIQVESQKIQVSYRGKPDESHAIEVAGIAARYASALPHVNYIAVGNNFSFFQPNQNAETDIVSKFLKKDSGVFDTPLNLAGAGISVYFDIDHGYMRLNIESAESNESLGVQFQANCHRKPESGALDIVKNNEAAIKNDLQALKSTIRKIYRMEE